MVGFYCSQSSFLCEAKYVSKQKQRGTFRVSLSQIAGKKTKKTFLVGGFNPFEKYARQNGIISPRSGVKIQKNV